MLAYSIISSLACVTYLYLGILVLAFGKKSQVQRSFVLLCTMLALWALGSFGQQVFRDRTTVAVFERLYFSGSELFILAGIMFILFLTDGWKSLGLQICFILISTRITIYQVANIGFGLLAKGYPSGFWFVSHQLFAGLESLSIPILAALWGRKSTLHRERIQGRIISISTVCGSAIGILLDFMVGSRGYPPLSFCVPLLWMAAVSYAILRYGLLRFSPASIESSLMIHMDQPVFMVDRSWTITDINGSAKALIKATEIPQSGIPMKEIFIDAEQIERQIESVVSSGKSFYSHAQFIRNAIEETVEVIANYSIVNDCWKDRIGVLIICYPKTDLHAFIQRYGLSDRQTDILRHILSGRSQSQMAEALFISLATVKTHTASLYAKLGISSRSELHALLRGDQVKGREAIEDTLPPANPDSAQA